MKITISPTDLESLLAPYYGWKWRVDAICHAGRLTVSAESENLRIDRRCPAQLDSVTASQATSLLVNPLYELAQLGVKERLWPISIDGRSVKMGHAEYEMMLSRVDMQRDNLSPARADCWFAHRGELIGEVHRPGMYPLSRQSRRATVKCGDSSFLLEADEAAAFYCAVRDGGESRLHRSAIAIHSENSVVRLLAPVLAIDVNQFDATASVC